MITAIMAVDQFGGIGLDGELAWHHPEDLAFFKDNTLGKTCFVGRSTFEKMPKLLGREVLVITSNPKLPNEIKLSDAVVIAAESPHRDFMVIGGKSIYEAFHRITNRVLVTHVFHKNFINICDCHLSLDFTSEYDNSRVLQVVENKTAVLVMTEYST